MKKLFNILAVLVFSLTLMSSGCQPETVNKSKDNATSQLKTDGIMSDDMVRSFSNSDRNAYGREQLFTESSQANFNKTQPPTMLPWSLEREQLNQRNLRWNDKNKLSYIYLLSDMGTVIGYFPIRGKVSSVNSKLTTNQQLIRGYYQGQSGVVESPSMDGSYGSNGDAVFFFLTDGTYMEWSGKYLLCDNYVKLSQEPLMTYNVKKK